MMMQRPLVTFGVFAVLACGASGMLVPRALAEDAWPSKPVRIIVDSAAGSANDFTARTLADKLGKVWNQQVVILNQPGAGGGLSARTAASATPDGYTLYL